MANQYYYQTIKTMTADLANGRPGTQYYHNTPASQEFYKAAKFSREWGFKLDDLFKEHEATSVWYFEPWAAIRREGRAHKGKERTPRQAFEELLTLMDKSIHKWIDTIDYGMPCPCWEKWNAVVEEGFRLIKIQDQGKPYADFNYAEEMTVEWNQTISGKRPINTFDNLVEG